METLRIGVVGTGGIGRTHIERINNTLQGGKVVACADANIDFCKSVAEKYGIKAYETILRLTLSCVPPLIRITKNTFWLPSQPASMCSAKSRWLPRQMPASASSRLR